MSFFGGGGSAVKTKEYIVTPADNVDDLVIPIFECVYCIVSVQTDSLYDGEVGSFLKQENGMVEEWSNVSPPTVNELKTTDLNGMNLFQNFTIDGTQTKFPFNIGFGIFTKATQGSAVIKVNYI